MVGEMTVAGLFLLQPAAAEGTVAGGQDFGQGFVG